MRYRSAEGAPAHDAADRARDAVMFVVELVSGLYARSTALLSESLDNLGNALTHGLSLYAVSRGARAK